VSRHAGGRGRSQRGRRQGDRQGPTVSAQDGHGVRGEKGAMFWLAPYNHTMFTRGDRRGDRSRDDHVHDTASQPAQRQSPLGKGAY